MISNNRNELGKIIKQRRLMIPMTLKDLAAKSGVSGTHMGRIERGGRSPSAHILRKIAKPLGFGEVELFTLADFLSPRPSEEVERPGGGQLDPYVAAVLSQESVETQRAVVAILTILKSVAKGRGCDGGFAESKSKGKNNANL